MGRASSTHYALVNSSVQGRVARCSLVLGRRSLLAVLMGLMHLVSGARIAVSSLLLLLPGAKKERKQVRNAVDDEYDDTLSCHVS